MNFLGFCHRFLAAFVVVLTPFLTWAQDEDASVTYDKVQPVFKRHCVSCHGAERERGDLNLSTTTGIQAGSSSGPVAVAGKPDESLLYTLPAHLETPRMPPGKPKLPQRELDLIRSWIEGGMQERASKSSSTPSAAPRDTDVPSASPTYSKSQPTHSGTRVVEVTPLPRKTAITALAINPADGRIAVSGLRQIVMLSESGNKTATAIAFPEGDVFALRFSRDGQWLLAGGGIGAESGKVIAIDLATGKQLFEVGKESDVVLAFDISPDHSLIALGGPGRVVKVYRTTDGELVTTLRKHTDWILSIAFSPDGLLLASSDRFGSLQVWEAKTGKPFHSMRGHIGAVNAVAWSRNSEQLLSGGQDGMLRLWDMHQGTCAKDWNAEVGGVLSLAWASDRIAAGGRGTNVAVFNSDGQRLQQWSIPDEVTELASNSDCTSIVAGDAAGNLAGWRVANGEAIGRFELPITTRVARAELAVPSRKQRSRPTIDLVESLEDQELAKAREALVATEAAVNATEESLTKLKTTAETLRKWIDSREAVSKKTGGR